MRLVSIAVGVAALLALIGAGWFAAGWYGEAELEEDTPFVIPAGSTLTSVANSLQDDGAIASADAFLLRAKLLGGGDPVQAGEFLLEAGMSPSAMLAAFQSGDVIRRFVTIPEGTPSILVHELLLAEPLLTGTVAVPEEGSVLPDTYDFERGEDRAAVLARMQAAMDDYLAKAWAARKSGIAVDTPQQAVTLASIVEKETGVASERRTVAGLYSNRLELGMKLQADPTIIYPITRGKPLGRRIRRSEIDAINDYNTYSMVGLPKAPITNPGRKSIAAVLDPANTDAIYMMATEGGAHEFNTSLAAHEDARERWYKLRRARGEM